MTTRNGPFISFTLPEKTNSLQLKMYAWKTTLELPLFRGRDMLILWGCKSSYIFHGYSILHYPLAT